MKRGAAQSVVRMMSGGAPYLSIAILLLLPLWLRHDPSSAEVFGPEPEVVVAAAERAPYRIGRWVGQDADVPEAAARLLRPNVLLGRRFVDIDSGMAVSFFLVHCSDARDMLGHYPPVCYPNSGWVLEEPDDSSESRRVSDDLDATIVDLTVNGVGIQAHQYEFSRIQGWSTQTSMRVFNFFILPDGSVARDIEAVRERTNWLGASVQGVAQVQLVTGRDVPSDSALVASDEILDGMAELFSALGVGCQEEEEEEEDG